MTTLADLHITASRKLLEGQPLSPPERAALERAPAPARSAMSQTRPQPSPHVARASLQPGAAEVARQVRYLAAQAQGDTVRLAPAMARAILDSCNWQGQRPINPHRVERTRRWIEQGQWIGATSIIEFAMTPDQRVYLVNGQHRLTACLLTGQSIEVRLNIVPCDDMAAVRQLYACHDRDDGRRTKGEVLDAIGIAESIGISRAGARALYDALGFLRNGMEPPGNAAAAADARDADSRHAQMHDWAREAGHWEGIVAAAPAPVQRSLRRAGLTAVALYTLRHCAAKAQVFWRGVAEDDGLRRGDPRKALLIDLASRALNAGGARLTVLQPAAAWNAWHARRELRSLRIREDDPLVIAGTPLGVRRG